MSLQKNNPYSALNITRNPFEGWNFPDIEKSDFLFPDLHISEKGLFLITGQDSLMELAFLIANYRATFAQGIPLYLRADQFPEMSPLLSFLTEKSYNGISLFDIKYHPGLQYWPPNLSGSPPPESFRWLIVSSQESIWSQCADFPCPPNSFLERLLELYNQKEEHFSCIILEGQFKLEPAANFSAVLHRLKARGITVVVMVPSISKTLSSKVHWDTIIKVRKWRSHHCSNHRLIADIQNASGKKRYHLYHDEKNQIWISRLDTRYLLREPVKALLNAGLKSREIVDVINSQPYFVLPRPLTEASLAALKRFWGFRTYKRKKRPRTRRKNQVE